MGSCQAVESSILGNANSPGGKRTNNISLTNMRLVDNLSPRSKAFRVLEI
jgi:hypothetical protein